MFLDPVVNLLQNIVNKTTSMDGSTQAHSWDDLCDAYDEQAIVMGYLDHKVERGYMIRFGDIMGFSPRYRFDLCEYDEVPDHFIGKPLPFIILSLDPDHSHLVVSRIDAITEIYAEQLALLNKNQVVKGRISAVMEKLVTVDIAGLTCLVSSNEVSWQPFYHPSDMVGVGDEVSVKLLKVVPGKAYITASLKQLDNSCWQAFVDEYEVGSSVTVRVSNIADFGYFVSYKNQLSGILHWSELSWKPRSKKQLMVHSKGDILNVKVSDLDHSNQRVSFSLKAMQPDPAEQALSEFQVGDFVEGVVRSRTDFGLFVEISENFNGLLHFSNLSWFTNSKNNLINFRPGMTIRCQVVDVDKESERVGLGLKQLNENPFAVQPSPHSLDKSPDYPRPVHVVVTSFFQANCHNQVVALLNDLKHKMRQHVDLEITNLFFDEQIHRAPDIVVVLLSDDFFKSETQKSLENYLKAVEGEAPLIIPIVADTLNADLSDPLLALAALPPDRKPLQQWRVKSAYWSIINKALTKSVRYVAGLK